MSFMFMMVLTVMRGARGELAGVPTDLMAELPELTHALFESRQDRALGYADESSVFDCDFDTAPSGSTCNWVLTTPSGFDNGWSLETGETPSGDSNSGPSADKSGSGYYLYTESDKNINQNFGMRLSLGHAFSAHGISFYYYLRGSSIGTMKFQVSPDDSTYTSCWTQSGQTADANWKYQVVSLSDACDCTAADLSAAQYFRFYYLNGNSKTTGDAALDTLAVIRDPTSRPTKQPVFQPTKRPTLPPTPRPTRAPTPLPTFVPSQLPTAEPTNNPTLMPLPAPTEQPTEEPTPKPTVTYAPTSGSPAPTPQPTPQPSKQPTPQPTQVPSHSHPPSLLPTPPPSHTPTPAPTVVCGNGTYFQHPGTCTPCSIGSWPSDC
jgi:hypothetical protein